MIQTDQPTIFDSSKVLAAVSSKEDGNIKFEQSEDAGNNIIQLLTHLGLHPDQTVILYVNDPDKWDVIREITASDVGIDSLDPANRIHADALVTTEKNVALFLPTADCNPVIIHDPVKDVLALVHLGWRSVEANLADKVVSYMQEKYQSNPKDLLVYSGPAIMAESYIFKDKPKQASDPAWQPYLHKTDAGTSIDLQGYLVNRLEAAGVPAKNIEKSPVNTATADAYFSHYRAVRNDDTADDGRFATICLLQ